MRFFLRLLATTAATFGVILLVIITIALGRALWSGKSSSSREGHVAVIDVTGIILSASSTIKEIKELQESPGLKALVVRINSPGGVVAPSQELYEALKRVNQSIPVVVAMGALAASGGYYTALGARKIYADPGTLTASIGVIMEFANTEKLYNWAKVERFTLKAGKFKDIGSPLRNMTPEEKELMQKMLNDIHKQFKATVQERRKLSAEEVDKWADGRVMTGNQAYETKLVDALGGEFEAIAEAKKLAGLSEKAPVVYPESKGGLLKRLIVGDSEESLTDLTGALSRLVPPVHGIGPGWRVLMLAPIR